MLYSDISASDTLSFCRDEEGRLYRRTEGGWEEYPFNVIYQGYFPSCHFTALGYFDGQFYAAGVDGDNRTRLFSSMLGDVWAEQELVAKDPMGKLTVLMGTPVKMLCCNRPFRLFVITDAGFLAIIPECKKCIRIYSLVHIPKDVWIEGEEICIRSTSDILEKIPLNVIDQVRIAWSYGEELIKKQDTCIIDLRTEAEGRAAGISGYVSLKPEDVPEWIEGKNRETYLLFLCRFGVQADQYAKFARRKGFVHAYSLGGTEYFAHVK